MKLNSCDILNQILYIFWFNKSGFGNKSSEKQLTGKVKDFITIPIIVKKSIIMKIYFLQYFLPVPDLLHFSDLQIWQFIAPIIMQPQVNHM